MLRLIPSSPTCSGNLLLPLRYLVKTDSFDPDVCKSFLQRYLKKKADVVIASIEGYQMNPSQKERILLIRSHMESLEKELRTLDSKILTAVYQVVSTGEIWNPCDLYRTDMPPEMQDRQKVKAIKQALKLLASERMTVLQPEPIASTAYFLWF